MNRRKLVISPGFVIVCMGAVLFALCIFLPMVTFSYTGSSWGLFGSPGVTHYEEESFRGYQMPVVYFGMIVSVLAVALFAARPKMRTIIGAMVLFLLLLFGFLINFLYLRLSSFKILTDAEIHLQNGTFVFLLACIGSITGSVIFLSKYLNLKGSENTG